MSDYLGKDVFKLGFGLMRLPKNGDGSIDIAQTSEMVDRFIAAGGTYFDTAYVYDNGKSEEAADCAGCVCMAVAAGPWHTACSSRRENHW